MSVALSCSCEAFFALTRASAAATADLAPAASGVALFMAAFRAAAAFLCFSCLAIFSFSRRNFRASKRTFAFSAFKSSNCFSRISALAIR